MQVGLAAVGFRSLKSVHGRAVVRPERGEKLRRRTRVVEHVGAPLEGDLLSGHSCARESLDHVVLHAPRHGADEAVRRRWRIGGADLQDLCHQRRIVGDPVSHDDPATRPRHPYELLGYLEGPRSEHRPEHADAEVEAVILEPLQVRGVALLESAVGETKALCSFVARRDEIARDVDTQDLGPEPRRRQCRGPVTASEVQDLQTAGDSQALDECLAARSHALGDASEVALLPERLVSVHRHRFPSL